MGYRTIQLMSLLFSTTSTGRSCIRSRWSPSTHTSKRREMSQRYVLKGHGRPHHLKIFRLWAPTFPFLLWYLFIWLKTWIFWTPPTTSPIKLSQNAARVGFKEDHPRHISYVEVVTLKPIVRMVAQSEDSTAVAHIPNRGSWSVSWSVQRDLAFHGSMNWNQSGLEKIQHLLCPSCGLLKSCAYWRIQTASTLPSTFPMCCYKPQGIFLLFCLQLGSTFTQLTTSDEVTCEIFQKYWRPVAWPRERWCDKLIRSLLFSRKKRKSCSKQRSPTPHRESRNTRSKQNDVQGKLHHSLLENTIRENC